MNKLKEIQDRIATFKAEFDYIPQNLLDLVNIVSDLATEIERVENRLDQVEATLALNL